MFIPSNGRVRTTVRKEKSKESSLFSLSFSFLPGTKVHVYADALGSSERSTEGGRLGDQGALRSGSSSICFFPTNTLPAGKTSSFLPLFFPPFLSIRATPSPLFSFSETEGTPSSACVLSGNLSVKRRLLDREEVLSLGAGARPIVWSCWRLGSSSFWPLAREERARFSSCGQPTLPHRRFPGPSSSSSLPSRSSSLSSLQRSQSGTNRVFFADDSSNRSCSLFVFSPVLHHISRQEEEEEVLT